MLNFYFVKPFSLFTPDASGNRPIDILNMQLITAVSDPLELGLDPAALNTLMENTAQHFRKAACIPARLPLPETAALACSRLLVRRQRIAIIRFIQSANPYWRQLSGY